MNLKQIKNEGIKLGLVKELITQQQIVHDKIDNGHYALALQAAKLVVELLQELTNVTKERKPRADRGKKRNSEPDMFAGTHEG
jgi:hypothetical protein